MLTATDSENHIWEAQSLSRYIRTTWMLNARRNLEIPQLRARVRPISMEETDLLAETVRRRNVFARHSWENSFYIQRIRELADKTVIEVLRPGDPDDMLSDAQTVARVLERLAVLSSTFAISRAYLHRLLAITSDRGSTIDVTIGREFYYLRSKTKRAPVARGIAIDDRFTSRFERCGFPQMTAACISREEIARRLEIASRWLFESRQEPSMSAAIVKTAIALEALLIATDSEPLTQSLSERAAFLLSQDSGRRRAISKNIKSFYAARSAVVHGGRRRTRELSTSMLEAMDRLTLLLCLTLAENLDLLPSIDEITAWCNDQRWGASTLTIRRPYSVRYLTDALLLFDRSVS